MADRWTYRFYQMQNGLPGFTQEQHLFDLPVNTATFTTILQQTGQLSGTVQQSDMGVQSMLMGSPALHLLGDRTAVYVDLNGSLVWGGILQQIKYDSLAQTTQIQCQDWWGYLNQCRIISWNSSYTGADQLAIAADLVNIAQGAASGTFTGGQSPAVEAGYVVGGNVGIGLGYLATQALAGSYVSNQDITIAYAESAYKQIGQAISDMGTSAYGYDWSVDVSYVNGVPTKTFNLWYPRAGRTQQQQQAAGSAVVFNLGGSSGQKYIWQSGQTQTANVLFGAGSGSGNTAIASVASDPSMLNAGWPLMEQSVSYTDISDQSLLDAVTLANLYAYEFPVSQPQVQYDAGSSSDQPLGSYAMGDDCRLIIPPDPYFPSGYDSSRGNYGEQWWRVQKVQVTVNDQGKSNQTITFGTPPVIPGQ